MIAFNFTDISIKTPGFYGWFHTLFVILSIVLSYLVIKFLKNPTKKQNLILLWTFAIIMILGEFYKQYDYYRHGDWGVGIVNEYQWFVFPFQFCGTPLYVLPMALLIPHKKTKKACLTYLATFGLFGGAMALYFPVGVFRDRLGIDLQTMIHHVVMVVMGIYLWASGQVGDKKDFLKANGGFIFAVILAIILNVSLNNVSKGTIHLFYLNPNLETTLPVFPYVQKVSYILMVIIYIILFSLMGFIVYFIGKKIVNKKEPIYKNNSVTADRFELKGLIGYLVIGLVIGNLFFTKTYFDTIDFFAVKPHYIALSILGNLVFLLFVYGIIRMVTISARKRVIGMFIVSILLTVFMYVMVVDAKYYNTIFELNQVNMTKNPPGQMGSEIFRRAILDIFDYNQFRIFLPVIVLGIYYLHLFKKRSVYYLAPRRRFLEFKKGLIVAGFFLVATLGIFSVGEITTSQKWEISSNKNTYTAQTVGIYNFYLGHALTYHIKNDENIGSFEEYNTNQDTYTNIYGETFSKELLLSDLEKAEVSPKLAGTKLNGIFEGKNLYLVQVETFNHYILGKEASSILTSPNILPNLKRLMKESYVLDNFYDTVGLAHSCDGELAVATGLEPIGNRTYYWDYDQKPFDLPFSIPRLFKNKGYESAIIEGDVKEFYNMEKINREVYNYDHIYYFDRTKNFDDTKYNGFVAMKDKLGFDGEPLKLIYNKHVEGLDDKTMVNWLFEIQKEMKIPHLIHPITLNPHAPFSGPRDNLEIENKIDFPDEELGYLNYLGYMDRYFEEFIKLSKNITNSVFIFYGDHGATGAKKTAIEKILGKDLTQIEYRKEVKHINAFIYVPDDDSSSDLKEGLIKGVQSKVRSQVDLYRTIVELFNLNSDYMYFGVNVFSKEKTFAIDPKSLNIFSDDYDILGPSMVSDKKSQIITYYQEDPSLSAVELFNYAMNYKHKLDQVFLNRSFEKLKLD